MRRPVVVWIVVFIAGTSVLWNGLELLATLSSDERWPVSAIYGQILQSAGSTALSAWILRVIVRVELKSRLPIYLYLCFLLVIYPIRHALSKVGLGLLAPPSNSRELLVAAIAEIVRYIALLTIIAWVAASKALRVYLLEKNKALVA
jgi:predicted transcriptional regulator with HTH domain